MPSRSMEIGVALRALAILMVVFNHSHPDHWFPLGLGGGMMFLMLLSGQNFAKFALGPARDAAHVRRASLMLAWQVFWPSLLVVLLWFVLRREFNVWELLFVRNLVDTERLAKFPVWYVQVLIQMMLMMAAAFSVPALGRTFLRNPIPASAAVWVSTLLLRYVSFVTSDDPKYVYHLPTNWFFDFSLGWLLYFLVSSRPREQRRPWLLSAAIVVSGFLASSPDVLNFYWLVVGGLALVWLEEVRVPVFVAQPLQLVSQATFTVFLTHRMFFVVCEYAPIPYVAHPDVKFVVSTFGGVVTWIVLTSLRRAWMRL